MTSFEGDPNAVISKSYFGKLLNPYPGVRNVSAGAGPGRLFHIDRNLIELFVAGDVDRDGDVDEDDLTVFGNSTCTCNGDPEYNADAHNGTATPKEAMNPVSSGWLLPEHVRPKSDAVRRKFSSTGSVIGIAGSMKAERDAGDSADASLL